jgi:hypothetical protein
MTGDGAGLANAFDAGAVLSPTSRHHGTGPSVQSGHDYHSIGVSQVPNGGCYPEVWNAKAAPGERLRVAAHIQARPSCGSPASITNCSPTGTPWFWLAVYEGSTLAASSFSSTNSYQYVSLQNYGSVSKNYTIKVCMVLWNGLTSSTFGIAWRSGVPE